MVGKDISFGILSPCSILNPPPPPAALLESVHFHKIHPPYPNISCTYQASSSILE